MALNTTSLLNSSYGGATTPALDDSTTELITNRRQTKVVIIGKYAEPAAETPAWFNAVVDQLSELVALPDNWDSYGAARVDWKVVVQSLQWLGEFLPSAMPAPAVIPTNRGTVQFEWHRNGVDLEVLFESPTSILAYSCDESSGDEWEGDISNDLSHVRQIVSRVVY